MRSLVKRLLIFTLYYAAVGSTLAADNSELTPLIAKLRTVGPNSTEQASAEKAWKSLAKVDAAQITALLGSIEDGNPLAANWIRSAIDAAAEDAAQHGRTLPVAELEKFLADRKHNPRARRLAFELLASVDKTATDRLIPTMLDDPSPEFRRDAVARALADAAAKLASGNKDAAASDFEKALKAARDEDQVKTASDKLKELGRTVDLSRHFGFIMDWKLIGPFDNIGGKGFSVAYPPEREIDFAATYPAKPGIDKPTVGWFDHATTNEYGVVDLNKAIGKHMGAVGYATASFESKAARPIELRLASAAALKVWLNGNLLFETGQYHSLIKLDQFIGRGALKRGKNVILLKVCQNEQTDTWAQDWQFQLRICDENGTAVLSTDRKEASDGKGK